MAELYAPSGDVTTVTPANGDAFTLPELQGFVGGYIEAVYLRDGRVMFVNEDGKHEHLPANHAASQLLYAAGGLPSDHIVGTAIVCSWREAGGESDQEETL